MLLENCVHDYNNINNPFNIIKNDKDFKQIILQVIFYGNLNSRCKKKLTLHSRLNSIHEIEKHQLANEFEKFLRIKINIHNYLFLILIVLLVQIIIYK